MWWLGKRVAGGVRGFNAYIYFTSYCYEVGRELQKISLMLLYVDTVTQSCSNPSNFFAVNMDG